MTNIVFRAGNQSRVAEALTANFRFKETTLAGGRPDAIIGCAVYNPRWPVRCSMNDLLIFGVENPKPVIMNVTWSKIELK